MKMIELILDEDEAIGVEAISLLKIQQLNLIL